MGKGRWTGMLVAAMVLVSHPADARWIRADTDNFIIYSEGSERSLRSFAENLQRFDSTLRFRFGVSGGLEANRLEIYLVPRADDAGRLASGKSGSSIAGFYHATSNGSFAVSNRENDEGLGTPASQQVLFHEYGHHFMKRHIPAAFPAWFVEGFAEYYSTVDFTKDGRASLGKPVHRRADGLTNMPELPAETLLLGQPSDMRGSGQMDVYYGRAWLLTHMLYNVPSRKGQLLAYMEAINRGESAGKAARDVFGDLAQLDKELNRYLDRRIGFVTLFEPSEVSGTITITVLPPAEDAVVPLRLERLSADDDPARMVVVRDALRRLTSAQPGDAAAWYELAEAEWGMGDDQRDLAGVRSAVDKALALAPDHVRANVLLGRLLAKELDQIGEYSPEAWRGVRAPIVRANRANPDDPIPLYAFYQSYLSQGVRPPEVAVQGLARAFLLQPENTTIRIGHVFALANQGKYAAAENLAKTVAFDPHDQGDGKALLERLAKMREQSESVKSEPSVSED